MNQSHPLLALLLLPVAGCTSLGSAPVEHPMQAELRVFQNAQRVFRSQNSGTHEFDFEGHGRVTVREITLDGFPGNTHLRCRFHYQNRTSQPIFQAYVSLDVLDPKGRIVSTQTCHCIVPTPMPLARGSYYSDELHTPTYDAHLQPGWSWQIRCHADPAVDDEPLDPPVPQGGVRQSPPMLIKDRNWPHDR